MKFKGLTEKVIGKLERNKQKGYDADDEMLTPNDQTPAEKELCSYIRKELDEMRMSSNRVVSEGQWLTNSAYLLGYTNLFYDTNYKIFRPISAGSRSLKGNNFEFNYILPNIQNRLARLTKTPPRYAVAPESTSDEDRESARLGEYVINQIWDSQRINKKRLTMTMGMQQAGHAYFKASWDPTLGPMVPFMDTDEDGKEVLKYQTLGDIRIDYCSAFEVFVDGLAKSHEDINKLIHAKIQPISYFRTKYPERGHMVKPESVWLQSLQYENRINTINNETGSGGSQTIENSAIELMYYEKPSYKYPKGRHIISANGVLLKNDELPIGEIPFAKFDDILVAGKYNSESVITHLRSMQDQANRTKTKRAQWMNRMLNGKYMAPRGSGLKESALNDQSGEVVEYDIVKNGSIPTYLAAPPIPQYAYNEDDYIKRDMDEMTAVNAISKGNVPSAGIPAIGMQFLQEMDDTRIGTITENNEYGYADLGRYILKFAHKNYSYPRLLKRAGKGMEYAVKSFIGADLPSEPEVTVIRNSTLPGSRVLRRQEILNLHQGGYLGDPSDPQVAENVLQMLEYGDVGDVWKDYSIDKAQIDKHLNMCIEGQKPPVSEFDNHPLFIKEFNRFRKSEKFDSLPDANKLIIMEVMEDHLSFQTDIVSPETSEQGTDLNPANMESEEAQAMHDELQQQVQSEIEQQGEF